MTLLDYYLQEKQRFLENCTQCGLCAKGCPILPLTDVNGISPRDIQKGVFAFLAAEEPNHLAHTKAFACMECFKCAAGMCPENLNPMLVNQLIKGDYIARGRARKPYGDARQADSEHRVLASILVSASEYRRITTACGKDAARYVFFPGCNVYFQPEKILNAMDIMDAIGDEYAFLPGLDHCCGENLLFYGDIREGVKRAEELMAAIAGFQPEAVVLWCPTCHCCFEKSIAPGMHVPFEILSFPQYLAANMEKLSFAQASGGAVTLHDPCKSVYTGVDREGPREVLRQLPGVTLREMAHHGRDTMCCGSGAISWFPESCDRIRARRLQEAAQTGAERMVTVCHYCNQTFASQEAGFDLTVTNYVNLVAEAMGIQREEKFRQYALWGSVERILADAGARIAASPFDDARIVEVLNAVFAG